ncbi:MAG: hypothetical protein L3K01_08395 [Thermoplasmata archaeon]|nr:hypothetical protein [Thermoplasmata archaeon]MCI4329013.1 hypothetical protein [Thermoplasmata archaeon]MCI4330009.1 hypothetical protein [Thermoplasmata archaeon]MCI4333720.1 hypothetical protein [Thermoplasmata archaeon]
MPPFRASDDQVDREIETLEQMARLRLRRYATEMRDLDRDLSELRRERARRRAAAQLPVSSEPVESSA